MCGALFHRVKRFQRQKVITTRWSDRRGPHHGIHAGGHHDVTRADQIGRPGPQQSRGGVVTADPEFIDKSAGELGSDLGRSHHSRCRALRDRLGKKAFRVRHGQQGGNRMRSGAFTEDRHVVRITTEGGDVLAHPPQGRHQIAQEEIALDRGVPG